MLLLLAYSQYRPGLLVNISTGELPLMKKIIQPQMSIMPRLGNPSLEEKTLMII